MKIKSFVKYLFIVALVVTIVIPKSGIKLYGIPITLGNVLFGIFIISSLFVINYKKFSKYDIVILFVSVFFSIRVSYSFIVGSISLADFFSRIIPLVVYPIVIIIITKIFTKDDLPKLIRVISGSFVVLIIYCLIQLLFGIEKTCIPGITVNLSDYMEFGPQWYLEKHNTISTGSKLVGTYQNGNLLGINLLIFLPIVHSYFYHKGKLISLIFFALTSLVILFSMSRSAWIGLFIYSVFIYFSKKPKSIRNLALHTLVFMIALICAIGFIYFIPSLNERLFGASIDTILGMNGRFDNISEMLSAVVIDWKVPVSFLFGFEGFIPSSGTYEMLPITIFIWYGSIGFLVWFFLFFYNFKMFSYVTKIALLVYIVTSFFDGGFWLVPTALNIYIVMGIGLLNKNYLINDKIGFLN
ncbi:MAG: hypothetical protein ACRC5M_02205 [Anaeroplasmataceae bacterium]